MLSIFFLLNKLAPHGDIGLCELRMIAKGERLIHVRIQATAIPDEAGGVPSWHFAISDITKQKEAEAALKKARDDLELRVRERTAELEKTNAELNASNRRLDELNKELQDFTFIASHDLHEPLRKVSTFGDMLVAKCGVSLNGASRDYIARMKTATARMQNLLDSLLLYSRVTTKTAPIKNTDLGKSVEAALSNLEMTVKEKNACVEVGDLPTVSADRVQMIQLFQNLIGNALKYHRDGEAPRVRIYSGKTGDEKGACEILVEDNGIGFEKKYLERIFFPSRGFTAEAAATRGWAWGLRFARRSWSATAARSLQEVG